jgi:hypothetical protein
MPVLSDRDDIIVITDEAHRSQYDQLAANMRRALPDAGSWRPSVRPYALTDLRELTPAPECGRQPVAGGRCCRACGQAQGEAACGRAGHRCGQRWTKDAPSSDQYAAFPGMTARTPPRG